VDYGRANLAETLAAEYVAGTLRGGARRRFDRLLPAHPQLQHAVREWQARLMPLTGEVRPVTPPSRVWQGITRRLWTEAGASAAATRPGWWQRLSLWRGLAGAGALAVLVLSVLLASPPAAQAPIVVVLQGTPALPGGDGAIVASLSGDGRALATRPVQPVALQTGRALELWAVPASGAPRSLGTISPTGTSVVGRERLPGSLLGTGVSALAVTIEPPGGSPTGQPTGPIVYLGRLQL
jgi:anti-sigma-K factor RskA